MAKKATLRARLTLDNSLYMRGMRQAERAAKALKSATADAARNGLRVLEVAAIAGAAAFAYGVKNAYDLGREMKEMSDKTGIAVDQLMVLNQAAKSKGIDDISVAIKKMQISLHDAAINGAGPAAKAFSALGLDQEELIKKSPLDEFTAIGRAIESIHDPVMRTASAVAIFGRDGSQMLKIFADSGSLGKAAERVGQQAQILQANAAQFAEVSEALNAAGTKMQGFFVGVAANILPLMEQVADRFDKLDLAQAGEDFGEGIRKGVAILEGAFADPGTFVDATVNYLEAGLIWAANLFAERMVQNAANFAADMLEGIDTVQNYLAAGLQYAIEHGVAFFKGNFAISVAVFATTMIQQLSKVASFFGEVLQKAMHFALDATGLKKMTDAALAGLGSALDGKKPRSFQEVLDSQDKNSALKDAANAMRVATKGIVGKDFFGASKYVQKGNDAVRKLEAKGGYIPKQVASPIREMSYQATFFSSLNGGLSTGGLATGGLRSRGLAGGAYGQTELLNARERRSNENNLVSLGLAHRDSRRSIAGAYNVVRSGDRARARNVEREKQETAAKNLATNTANIADNTAGMFAIWGGAGKPSSGN